MFLNTEEEKMRVLEEKNTLISSKEYELTKRYKLENILRLSATGIEPLILKGMLYEIYCTDQWKQEFHKNHIVK